MRCNFQIKWECDKNITINVSGETHFSKSHVSPNIRRNYFLKFHVSSNIRRNYFSKSHVSPDIRRNCPKLPKLYYGNGFEDHLGETSFARNTNSYIRIRWGK